ncbi:MAG TPA: hypothetical protein VMM93_05830 [Vicinamibacterales bacterium]|nr:hypothetical protein [Vicinamibacterales bacterium]
MRVVILLVSVAGLVTFQSVGEVPVGPAVVLDGKIAAALRGDALYRHPARSGRRCPAERATGSRRRATSTGSFGIRRSAGRLPTRGLKAPAVLTRSGAAR